MADEQDRDRARARLIFADEIPSLRATPTLTWLRVREAVQLDNEDRHTSAALIPSDLVAEVLQEPDWDDHEPGPTVWSDNNGHHAYSRTEDTGIEPLAFVRSYSGQRPPAVELREEFRLFHDLYFDVPSRQFLSFDEAGDPISIARLSADGATVEILTRAVRQFMAWKETHLALYVVWNRYSTHSLTDLSLREVRRHIVRDAASIFSLTVVPCDWKNGFQSFGRLLGKVLVPPLARETSGWGPFEEERSYQSFIIDVDQDGNPIEMSCAPEVSEVAFLTKVWFRAEVLKKYQDEPSRYTVRDGHVACGGRWDLPIDNDHTDHVVAFLGDLRSLPEKEQRHWRVHNVAPAGTLSETAFRRSFLAEWAVSTRPEHRFARAYAAFMEHFAKLGVEIIRPLTVGDEHCLNTLHVPHTEEVATFDQQVGNLTKLLVDSLNDAELARHITLEKDDRSIRKLEKYLAAKGLEDYEVHTGLLRDLYAYRSTNAVHRRGRGANNAFEKLAKGTTSRREAMATILERATAVLEYLQATHPQPAC